MAEVWQQQSEETNKAYAAFKVFLDLGLERSLMETSRQLGKHHTLIERWARKNDWWGRAKAYDQYIEARALVVREATLSEYEAHITSRVQAQLIALDQIVDVELRKLQDKQAKGEAIQAIELKRLSDVIAQKDTLARRLAGLPTALRSKSVDDDDPEGRVYYVGGLADD